MKNNKSTPQRWPILAALGLLLAAAPAAAGDHLPYRVAVGDTLIGIGQRLLDEPRQWRRLQAVNRLPDPDRLTPGRTLLIPVKLLCRVPVAALVTHVQGSARTGDTPLVAGAPLAEGEAVSTGDHAFVTVKTPDGSIVRLQPRSTFRLAASRAVAGSAGHDVQLELKNGRLESDVAKVQSGLGRFEIHAPLATIGIRGTRLRVAAGADETSAVELTAGEIGVQARGSRATTRLTAGQGLLAAPGAKSPQVLPLLPAPDMQETPARQERIKVALPFAPLAGAVRYRAQVAGDEAFTTIVAETEVEQPLAKFADLADGDYWLRVRGVDGHGLEGYDGQTAFRLKARPEPPFVSAPRSGAKVAGERVAFSWAAADGAATYRFQLARDAALTDRLVDVENLSGGEYQPDLKLLHGEYFWRVASTRADGDRGPFGDTLRFTLKPPTQAEAPAVDGGRVSFAWSGEPGQTFEFQLADDPGFSRLLTAQSLAEPSLILDKPAPGTYFMRVRATDADGFVGAFSAPQRFEVLQSWWPFLLLLAPLL